MSMQQPLFSIIIPAYNRPDEVQELLESLEKQTVKNFEVIIVEVGSVEKCKEKTERYKATAIHYYY